MRYQVPQFVDIEDKIIGPFTLKQFLIYLSGAFALIPLYLIFDLSLFVTVAIPVLGIAALFAHLKVHGKTLFSVMSNAVNFVVRGQLFLWRRVESIKPLRIQGEEFGDFSYNRPVVPAHLPALSGLEARARALETEGHVTNEDLADPLVAEKSA